MKALRHYFSFDGRSSRAEFAAVGFLTMFLKYGLDFVVIRMATGRTWTPWQYLSPLLDSKLDLPAPIPTYLICMMIPCVWLALAMGAKRIRDAGLSMLWTFWLLVPIFNYFFMLLFCVIPGKPGVELPLQGRRATMAKIIFDARFWMSVVSASLLGCLGLILAAQAGNYGNTLFLLTPFLMGLLQGFAFARSPHYNRKGLLAGAFAVWLVSVGFFLLFALEGIICLTMVAPIAIPIILFSSLVGAELARTTRTTAVHLLPLLAFSSAYGILETGRATGDLQAVSTSIEIAAPIDTVWTHVIDFPPLPEPPAFVKNTGIAFPVQARIEGRGVGAIRYCEFSTGPFIEPITVWNAPTHLAFDVTASPPPMQEWNPFHTIHPPHLEGYFVSKKGEFRLESLGPRLTRVTGTTWYTLDIHPLPYWRLWADGIVHGIHERVLGHVKTLSEQGQG